MGEFVTKGNALPPVHGDVAPGFEGVRTEFLRNFAERGEIGAAVAAYWRGEKVVDLWGGRRLWDGDAPWEEGTMVVVHSTTKGVSALALAVAHARGWIDYDARRRDPATEAELEVARARLRRTLTRMEAFQARGDSADRPILVVMDAGGDSEAPGLPLGETPPSTRGASSVGRELQYLIAHTVHHFALMAVALRLAGFEPHADFGVAPSTLRFEARNGGPCVR